MLTEWFAEGVPLGLAQAAVVTALAVAAMLLARRRSIHLERETLVALARGFVQILAVGSVLVLLLRGPGWTGFLMLAAMTVAAAAIARRRAAGIPAAFRVSLAAIAAGAGSVIVVMTALGVIDPAITSLVPVGSMVIANAMNSNALALDRFASEVRSHAGFIEAGLALGAEPQVTVRPYVQAAVKAALIPRIDTLRSLGIVWIPGIMAGMVLSGADPVYAAIYQFVIVGMIYGSSGLTTVVSTLLIRHHAFSAAAQLTLKPEGG
jgi:putative ABC transport system permease protein